MVDPNKSYRECTDDELREMLVEWEQRCSVAAGWSSAYFSAKQIATVCSEARRRGLSGFKNSFPITRGAIEQTAGKES
jgi:hypothetical protein